MFNNILYYKLHKVQPFRLNGAFLEGEGAVTCLYVGGQGVIKVGNILWIGLGYLSMVDQLG